MTGWVKLHRAILGWEWYTDANTFRVFMHILLNANYQEKRWQGITILPGQLVTSYAKLSVQTRLSIRQVRVTLDKLKMTGELTIKNSNKYSLITIVKWNDYQSNDMQDATQMTSNSSEICHSNDKQMTTTKEYKKERMEEGKNNILSDFENFWIEYPAMNSGIKGSKKNAKAKYVAIIKKGEVDHGSIMEGLRNYIAYLGASQRVPSSHAEFWLSKERWADEYGSTMPAITHSVQPEWKSEGDRLAAKYREEAERERESYVVAEYQ